MIFCYLAIVFGCWAGAVVDERVFACWLWAIICAGMCSTEIQDAIAKSLSERAKTDDKCVGNALIPPCKR